MGQRVCRRLALMRARGTAARGTFLLGCAHASSRTCTTPAEAGPAHGCSSWTCLELLPRRLLHASALREALIRFHGMEEATTLLAAAAGALAIPVSEKGAASIQEGAVPLLLAKRRPLAVGGGDGRAMIIDGCASPQLGALPELLAILLCGNALTILGCATPVV